LASSLLLLRRRALRHERALQDAPERLRARGAQHNKKMEAEKSCTIVAGTVVGQARSAYGRAEKVERRSVDAEWNG
jgi:hypothetical protein